MAAFEVSSIYVGGLKKALEPLKLTPAELSTLSEVARKALEAPNSARWFPGEVMFDVLSAVAEHRGFKAVQEVNVAVTAGPLLTVVGPLLRVALAFSKSPVSAAMSRIQQFGGSAIRNVTLEWKETSAKTGDLTITYEMERIPHEVMEHAWRGVFLAMNKIIGAETRIEKADAPNARTLLLHFAW